MGKKRDRIVQRKNKMLAGAFLACLALLGCSLFWILPPMSGGPAFSAYFQDDPDCINVNTAPVAELMCLEGIGEKRAQAIVEYREKHGAYASLQDLEKVPGISEGILEKIQYVISF